MPYIQKPDERKNDNTKIVNARVSEDVLAALNIASDDMHLFGYDFSITKVIEKALDNTLSEINEKTQPTGAKLFANNDINLILKIKLQIEAIPINPKQHKARKDDGTCTYIILTESP